MTRRWPFLSASVVLLVATLFAPPARALDEPERLRLVGERTFADGLYPIARRVLERLVADYPKDDRIGDALFLLGRARFALGDIESALEAFRRAQAATPPPASLEAKFWEAETLFRLRRFAEAHAAYDVVVKNDAAAPHAPDAAYSLAWSDLELRRPEAAVAEFHELAPAARRTITETLTRSGDPSELQGTYKMLMEQTPPTPEALYDAGSVAGRLGRPSDQETAWRRLRKEFPDHPLATRAALDLGNAAFKRKEWKEAAAQGNVATQSKEDGTRAEALLLVGQSELKLGHYRVAAKAFDAVGGVKDVEAEVRYRALAGLGLAREQLKDLPGALAAYQSVASNSPYATMRDWARDRAQAVKNLLGRPPAGPSKNGGKP